MKRMLLIVFVSSILCSCSSDDQVITTLPQSNFYALTVGNSWVYKNYRYNVNTDVYELNGVIDSISVVDTEIIEDNTFFKLRRLTTGNEAGLDLCYPNGEHFELVRDSLGYLIGDDGQIKFVNNNFEERIIREEPFGSIRETLQEGQSEITVEAGTFTCINSERYAVLTGGNQAPGLDKFYYSDGIGLIYDTISFVTQDTPGIIRRLDSYSVQ